jgi:hypothetical protein
MQTLLNKLAATGNLHLREWQRSALLFAAVVVAAFPQVVFMGRSLVPSDNHNPLDFRYSAANYGPNYAPPEEWSRRGLEFYANFHDPGGGLWQAEPAHHFFRKAIFSGQFPFWDPHAGGGAPAYTNPTSEFLFPPQIVLSLAGATSLQKNIYILLLFWTSGYATYWLLRLHRLPAPASFAGGMAFLFCGAVQQLGPSIFTGQVVACMPVLLLATKWFVNFPSWRRTACLALTYGTVSLASFPPFLVAGFGFSALYLICAVLANAGADRLLVLRRYISAILLSLACAAAYYVPLLFTVSYTDYTTEWYRTAGVAIMPFKAILELFSPVIAGTEARIYTEPLLKLSPYGHFYYVGVTVLLLAFMAGGRKAVGESKPLIVCCLTGSALILLKMFGVPPVQWIVYLPILQSIHYTIYFGSVVAFAICLLAAIGFQRLQERRGSALMFALTLAIMITGFLVLWHKASTSGGFEKGGAWRWVADYRLLIAFAGCASCLIMATWPRRVVPTAAMARWLLLALVAIEGIVNTTYPRQNRWDVFAHPPAYVSVVQGLQNPKRLFISNALIANLGSAFAIDGLDSLYMFSAPRVYALYQKYAAPASPITMRDTRALPPDPVLDKAAVNYLLLRFDVATLLTAAMNRGYATEYDDGYVRLFRRPAAPRYLFSSEYVVTDSSSALELIATTPLEQIVLETTPGFEASPNQFDDPEPQVISAKLNSLAVRLHSPRDGLLYIADAWYPGWRATVNNKPTPILVANYGFRAVVVPAGDVLVELSYLPRGFITGGILSFIGLSTVIALCWFGGGNLRKGAEASVPSSPDSASKWMALES